VPKTTFDMIADRSGVSKKGHVTIFTKRLAMGIPVCSFVGGRPANLCPAGSSITERLIRKRHRSIGPHLAALLERTRGQVSPPRCVGKMLSTDQGTLGDIAMSAEPADARTASSMSMTTRRMPP
jgi:hypothetical protein